MTRIFVLLFTVFFLPSSFSEPQVWQASKNGLTFTIMGSVHVGKKEFYPLPFVMDERLKIADALWVESDVIKDTRFQLPKGRTSRELLNIQQKKVLKRIALEINLPLSSLLNMPPWQTSIALQLTQMNGLKLEQALGVDLHYLSKSDKWDIPVLSFETVQEQIDLLASAGENGLTLLSDTLTHWKLSKIILPCVIEAWQAGDGKTLTKILDTQTAEEFEKKILDDRNHRWIGMMTNPARISPGNYVVVVGALHLYGKEGLLNLLTEKGFKVTLLTKGKEVKCEIPAQLKTYTNLSNNLSK